MVANELRILAKSAGQNLTEYVNSVVGVFEAPGTRSGVHRARKDTDARRTIYNEAIRSGIVGKDGLGLKEWQDFISRCVAHLPLSVCRSRWEAHRRDEKSNRDVALALDHFTQETLRRRRGELRRAKVPEVSGRKRRTPPSSEDEESACGSEGSEATEKDSKYIHQLNLSLSKLISSPSR